MLLVELSMNEKNLEDDVFDAEIISRLEQIENYKKEKDEFFNELSPEEKMQFLIRQYEDNEQIIKELNLKQMSENEDEAN